MVIIRFFNDLSSRKKIKIGPYSINVTTPLDELHGSDAHVVDRDRCCLSRSIQTFDRNLSSLS